MPAPGTFHTVALPVRPYASRQLAWPPQDPGSIRTYILDCTDWLADAGTAIAPPPLVLVDTTLSVGSIACDGKTVSVTVTGGVPNTVPVIAFTLKLANGDREDVNVSVPIVELSPAIPAGAIFVGSQPVLLVHEPIDVATMPPLPGAVVDGDGLLLYRPSDPPGMYLVSARSLIGGALSGGTSSGWALDLVAGANVSGHRHLMFDGAGHVVHGDPSDPAYSFAGVATQAAVAGAPLSVIEAGLLTEPSWAWVPGLPVFAGAGGVLTQAAPATGVLQQVGLAASATSLLVQPLTPTLRA